MTRPALTRLFCLAAVVFSGTAVAQPAVTWEQVPHPNNYGTPRTEAKDLAFLPAAAGLPDTLLAVLNSTLHRLDFDAATDPEYYPWTRVTGVYLPNVYPFTVLVTDAGTLLGSAPGGPTRVDRSTDGGRTWQRAVAGERGRFEVFFQPTLPALRDAQGRRPILGGSQGIHRSYGDGAPGTWEVIAEAPDGVGGEIVALGEVPPSPALPDGRLLAGVWNGVTYSDDGGRTWTPAAGAYGYARYIGYDFAFVPEPGHPYGGAVLAGIDDLALGRDSSATIYRSEDGGATWARAHRFSPSEYGLENTNKTVFAVTPDGAVWATVEHRLGGSPRNRPAVIVRSVDGGRTWARADAGYGGHGVYSLHVGRDGRLYAATVQGVWHTTGPAFATAEERVPGPPAALAVSVYPNPTASRATVELRLAAPEAVRVEVVDVRGRVVAVAHDGPAVDGQRVAVETAGLAPAVYVVRAVSATAAASAVLTVSR